MTRVLTVVMAGLRVWPRLAYQFTSGPLQAWGRGQGTGYGGQGVRRVDTDICQHPAHTTECTGNASKWMAHPQTTVLWGQIWALLSEAP